MRCDGCRWHRRVDNRTQLGCRTRLFFRFLTRHQRGRGARPLALYPSSSGRNWPRRRRAGPPGAVRSRPRLSYAAKCCVLVSKLDLYRAMWRCWQPNGAARALHRRRAPRDADPFILHLCAALAEKERRLISERELPRAITAGPTLRPSHRRVRWRSWLSHSEQNVD
jgi:hypothetical protein